MLRAVCLGCDVGGLEVGGMWLGVWVCVRGWVGVFDLLVFGWSLGVRLGVLCCNVNSCECLLATVSRLLQAILPHFLCPLISHQPKEKGKSPRCSQSSQCRRKKCQRSACMSPFTTNATLPNSPKTKETAPHIFWLSVCVSVCVQHEWCSQTIDS